MSNAVRAEIDAFYSRKVACCDAGPTTANTAALAPDYDRSKIPAALMQTSFGCGDPLAFAAVQPGDIVVDLGSGAGLDLLLAAEKVGPTGRVIGVDMSKAMLDRARQHIEQSDHENPDPIELRHGTIENLPIEDESVDWIISNCVINLSTDKPAVFSEINRVLRPGGQFLISDLVADELPEWINAHSDLYAACISGAVSETEYLSLAANVGLRDAVVMDRMVYDETLVRGLIEIELPVALDAMSTRLGIPRSALLDQAASALSGKVTSIKMYGRKDTALSG